ncbi:Amphiphysin [Eumeta japonica]|uniref:Amphiphysin n=1 Tax=Eumeta variegata TaxID=151549 RepID=A0A4C1YK23_EUMVA|nr:Amphiphysin [Eumeta japonica]
MNKFKVAQRAIRKKINDGASTPAAGATRTMQVDGAIASISALDCIDIGYVEHRLLKTHLAAASARLCLCVYTCVTSGLGTCKLALCVPPPRLLQSRGRAPRLALFVNGCRREGRVIIRCRPNVPVSWERTALFCESDGNGKVLLQNLGKVDRTLDDIFEEHLNNFNRQHQQATRLQKEFNNYIRCIRAVQTASKTLMEAITEVYESSWSGHDLLFVQAQNMEMLWQDFSHKLGDQVLIPLNTYTNQFPEMKKKIDKRGRKLVDYDSQRHSFQSLQANAAKRRDDVKLTRGREQLEEAKRTYELLNSELHDELPALHDSRVLFYVNNLQTLFSAEQVFHSESSKVYAELEAITDKLANESQRGSYTAKKMIANNVTPLASPKTGTLPLPPHAHNGNGKTNSSPADTVQTPGTPPTPVPTTPPTPVPITPPVNGEAATPPPAPHTPPPIVPASPQPASPTTPAVVPVARSPVTPKNSIEESTPTLTHENQDRVDGKLPTEETNDKKVEELYDIPVGATLAGLPPGVLYRVRATYRYTREDSDELSFDVGDVIRVVEYDDPDEQEEGWLMGIKETTNEKGMFPANFTRPI